MSRFEARALAVPTKVKVEHRGGKMAAAQPGSGVIHAPLAQSMTSDLQASLNPSVITRVKISQNVDILANVYLVHL